MKAMNPICLGVVHALIGKFRMGNGMFVFTIFVILFTNDFFVSLIKNAKFLSYLAFFINIFEFLSYLRMFLPYPNLVI